MSALDAFCNDPRIVRMGLALLHFLWQAAAVAALLAIALRVARKRPPNARYALALVALAMLAAAPAITFFIVEAPAGAPAMQETTTVETERPGPVDDAPAVSAGAAAPAPDPETLDGQPTVVVAPRTETAPAAPEPTWSERALATVRPWLPWAVAFWALGVLILTVWRLGGWVQVRRLARANTRPVGDALRAKLAEIALRLRVSRPVRLLESGLAAVPTVIGHFRPVILLPASALTGLSIEQIEAILAHELAHIRRWDYLVNLLQVAVETLLFYHPAVWWVSRRLRDEREHCCDDLALSICRDRTTYARALATMEELRAPRTAVAASGGSLLSRIRRIAGYSEHQQTIPLGWLALATLLTTLAIAVLVLGYAATAQDEGADGGVKLLGIRIDGDDKVYDRDGKELGRLVDYTDAGPFWQEDKRRCDFVFELSDELAEAVWLHPVMLTPSQDGDMLCLAGPRLERHPDGRRLLILPATLPRQLQKKPLEKVDFVLRYINGVRGLPDAEFAGPFFPDMSLTGGPGDAFTLTTKEEGGELSFRLTFTREQLTGPFYFGMPLIAYDEKGDWHLAAHRGGTSGRELCELNFGFPGLQPDRIIRLTFNEKPREATWRGLPAHFAGLPERHYAPWLDEAAKRLGLKEFDPEKLYQHLFETPGESVKCIDLVRGYAITQAWRAIRDVEPKLKPGDLSPDDAKRVRAAALAWTKTADPMIRCNGVELGLWGKWPEFVEPAMELVCEDHWVVGDAAYALYNYREHLTQEQLRKIGDILLTRDDQRGRERLWNCIRFSRENPAAASVMWDLAKSDKPWLWWAAVGYLCTWDEITEKNAGSQSEELRLKLLASGTGQAAGLKATDEMDVRANGLLIEILTPKFLAMDMSRFSEVLKRTASQLDQDTATRVLVAFLSRLLKEWDTHQVYGMTNMNWWAVDRCVRYLNKWHGTNIGGLGNDVTVETENTHQYDWKTIADEAIKTFSQGEKTAADLPLPELRFLALNPLQQNDDEAAWSKQVYWHPDGTIGDDGAERRVMRLINRTYATPPPEPRL